MTIKSTDQAAEEPGLADRLKARTWALHREAERSGILSDLLRGRAGIDAYALLLRNLLPVYEALEAGLGRAPPAAPAALLFARPELCRAAALRADLAAIGGPDWARLPVLPGATRYAAEVTAAASDHRLLAHAYVRYLGDLNGGQILKRMLGKTLGLGADQLGFYSFPAVADPEALAEQCRAALDRTVLAPAAAAAVVEEAMMAFRLNIALSEEVQRHPIRSD